MKTTRIAYNFNKPIAAALLTDAIAISYATRVDQLDCSVSFARQPTKKTVEEVIAIGLHKDTSTLFNFIYRDMSFLPQEYPENHNYWEIGFSTLCLTPDYFLWINLLPEDGYKLVKKYGLQLC